MKYFLSVLACTLFFFIGKAQQATPGNRYNIIPYPQHLQSEPGSFQITEATRLIVSGKNRFGNETGFLKRMLREYLGRDALKAGTSDRNFVELRYDPSLQSTEAYRLEVTPQSIIITAKDGAGMFYGIETLRQLLPAGIETGKGQSLLVPCVKIKDCPAFGWRGVMLDVSRHFFSVSYLKKLTDMMALYKLNTLHLHLTDDQGWRIEIKKYPKLTEEGAWRTFDNHDSACMEMAGKTGNKDFDPDSEHIIHKDGETLYGGFYTQAQMKDFIRYAAERHIQIIPEIDMPGHMMAAVRIYPQLTCDSAVGDVQHTFSNPICPCNEDVLQFAKDIFNEIADLFPSKYIDIGGDEVNKQSWAKSPVVQRFMKEKGFTNMNQIQSYFNDYILSFFQSKGKKLVGWDEIVEGHIDSSAVVMFWRAWAHDAPLMAAENHNKIVMSPDGPLYFDAFPDAQTLSSVYNYNPYDSVYHFRAAQEKNIIGLQGNLWTEMIPSEKRADYMLMPRMTALAELAWTHRYRYDAYLQRLNAQYARLDALQINYRLPDLNGLVQNYAITGKRTSFFVSSPNQLFTIHYTTDGKLPDMNSPVMDKPVIIPHPLVMKLALFTPAGRRGDVYPLNFNAAQYGISRRIEHLSEGLRCDYHIGEFRQTAAIKGRPDSILHVRNIMVPGMALAPAFGLKFNGYIDVPETGIYTFYLTSNDGSVLYIGDQKVIDNDGAHADKQIGGQAALEKGLHSFRLDFAELGGGYALRLLYSFKGSDPKTVPDEWLKSIIK